MSMPIDVRLHPSLLSCVGRCFGNILHFCSVFLHIDKSIVGLELAHTKDPYNVYMPWFDVLQIKLALHIVDGRSKNTCVRIDERSKDLYMRVDGMSKDTCV